MTQNFIVIASKQKEKYLNVHKFKFYEKIDENQAFFLQIYRDLNDFRTIQIKWVELIRNILTMTSLICCQLFKDAELHICRSFFVKKVRSQIEFKFTRNQQNQSYS